MSTINRIIIVALLICGIAAVLIAKHNITTEVITNSIKNASTNAPLPRLVDLGAGKCIPCKMMEPILKELKDDYANTFEVEFIDVWENPKEKEQYDIRMIPTQIFYDTSGAELFRHEGFFGKDEILTKWKELGVELPTVPGE